ncbi:MAG: glycoside hydrolase [Clostridia bacterium]|nr:glycoside hydrolase [Clostridia bacterium]
MEGFRQNNEITYDDKELMEENSFVGAEMEKEELPVYENVKKDLPQPIWENHSRYIDCYYKAWEIAFSNLRQPKEGTGFVTNFIDAAFNGCIFMWDSAFMLMFGKYADRIFKFQKTFDNFYSHQHVDGFICRQIEEDTGRDIFARHDPSSTGPEVMAWCEWDYFLNFGDKERLARVYPCLVAYHQWMREHFTWRDGTYFSSGYGCGMDNCPRLEEKYHVCYDHGHMIWVDACMQELNACNILIKMSEILGRDEFISELVEERDRLYKVINEKLWDDETKFYYDLRKDDTFNGTKHIGAFWSLLARCVPEDRSEDFIAHLNNENEFKTEHRVPTLSKDHEEYRPEGRYWCGSVWAPTNYMVLKGLDEYGKFDLAYETARNHLDNVVSVFEETGTLFENYAPEFAEGKARKGNWSKEDFVGWSGLIPISIMFEYVFGIRPDAAKNKITWHVNLKDRHGIEKYPFGTDGELTLICEKRNSADEKPEITVSSNIPVTVEIIWNDGKEKETITIN